MARLAYYMKSMSGPLADAMESAELLKALLGPEYRRDLVDCDSICGLMALQGDAISETVAAIENTLVIGQPGRADTVETEVIAAGRSKQHSRAAAS